jgi:hypothetical protein
MPQKEANFGIGTPAGLQKEATKMKTTLAIFALALGASISLQGAQASDTSRKVSQARNSGEDFSAAKKKKRNQVYVYSDGRYVLGRDGYYYPRAGTPGDPSWQSPIMLQKRAAGECIIDLGYGRWESCANAGGGGGRR